MLICSAIVAQVNDYPLIVCGKRHSNCLEKLWQIAPNRDKDKDIQGFMTDKYRFLDRYEAKSYAMECSQILPNCGEYVELYSEDIWAD